MIDIPGCSERTNFKSICIITSSMHASLKKEQYYYKNRDLYVKHFSTAVSQEIWPRGGKNFFLSGNLGRRLEVFCKISNVTITKIQCYNYNMLQNKCIIIVLFVL